jgi:hypothetical protein
MSEPVTRREIINKLAATAGVGALLAAATAEAQAVEQTHHEGKGPDLHFEFGLVNKPKEGALTVKFKARFADPPVVVLTPYWEGQNSGVGFIETLDKVTHSEFTLVSGNAAENYFVSWLAIGRKR